jgi:proteic killer suppression protein
MIISFADNDTKKLANLRRIPRFTSFERVALRKLIQLDVAESLDDLRVPPGNRLEALCGDRAGQYSIRINDRYRICFMWTENGPDRVEITDYH